MSERLISPDVRREMERGRNTEVRITFVRHAQKASPALLEKDLAQISQASISEAGAERARKFGKELARTGRRITKGFCTPVERTAETLREIFKEAPAVKGAEVIGEYLGFRGAEFSPEVAKKYNEIMNKRKTEYMAKNFPGRNWDDLSLDEQTEAAEVSEEPAMQWYLDHGKERPDPDTPSPYEAASVVAYKLNRFINVTDHMPDGRVLDLLTAGHRTSTESFLKYCLIREVEGEKVTGFGKLEEIGGSLGLLDSWDLDIKNDEEGNRSMALSFRGKKYGVDSDKLREMAEDGRKLLGKEKREIDEPIK